MEHRRKGIEAKDAGSNHVELDGVAHPLELQFSDSADGISVRARGGAVLVEVPNELKEE